MVAYCSSIASHMLICDCCDRNLNGRIILLHIMQGVNGLQLFNSMHNIISFEI